MADENKSEQPTGRKLAKARSSGQVAHSREVNNFVMLGTGAALVLLWAPMIAPRFRHSLTRFLDPASLLTADGIMWGAIVETLRELGMALMLPIIALLVAAVASTMVQTGWLVASERIGPDLSRLSPIAGFGRLFSPRGLIEFAKNVAKVIVVMALVGWALLPEIGRLPDLAELSPAAIVAELEHVLRRLLLVVLVAAAVLAIADYAYQRFQLLRSLRMSKQEVKEEHKQSEGDPQIKARLRQIRVERARRRMMAAVPKASVVVTNPTHFAVALQYELGDKGAPRVVAKGADLVAFRIRELAREHDVPLVENPPLARALYASVELDREIPPEHYRAVAEVISYVFRLKGKLRPR